MLPPNEKKALRQQITRFCLVAEKYEARWHYTQARPYTGLGVPPAYTHHNDCSSYVCLTFFWAAHMAQVPAEDPSGYHYSGGGNTDTIFNFLRAHRAPVDRYRVGDIALYLERSYEYHHAIVCRRAGTGDTSEWSSFGQEAGPQPASLHYRSDLTNVYRHPALI